MQEINKKDIVKYYSFIEHHSISEIRLIKPRWKKEKVLPISHFIKSEKEFLEACKRANGEWNIYVGINAREKNGKSDDDVKFITNIGHDIDAHEGGKEALQKAGQVAINIVEYCKENNYQEPLVINYGYG